MANLLSAETRGRTDCRLPVARAALTTIALAACSLVLLAAQVPDVSSPTPPQATAPPSVIRVQTNLVLVRVVVRDSHGNAVTGLSQSDFQILDNGKPQTISFFSADGAAAQPAPAGAPSVEQAAAPATSSSASSSDLRYTALFFDDYHLQSGELAQARRAAQGFLSKALGAGDSLGIFTPSGKVDLDFTTDADKLQNALAQLRVQPNLAAGECPKLTPYLAQGFLDNNPLIVSNVIGMTAECICGGPPNTCDPGTDLTGSAQGDARRAVAQSDATSEATLGALQNLIRQIGELPGEHRIGLLSDGFGGNRTHENRLSKIIDDAIRSNVTINAMAAYGLGAFVPGGDASQSSTGPGASAQNEKASVDADAAVIEEAVESTGGVFIRDTNNYAEGFARIGAVAEASYVIGFTPDELAFDGRFHKLKTTVIAHSDWSVQARPGYFATPPEKTSPGTDLSATRTPNASDAGSAAKPVAPVAGPGLQEENSFNTIVGTADADQQIRLSQNFLHNYPASHLAEPVDNILVVAYYSKKDWNNLYALAESALAKYPDDVDILVLNGWVISHFYNPNDADAAAKFDQAEKYLKYAIQIIPGLHKPAWIADQTFPAYKKSEISLAHSGLGMIYFYRREYGLSVLELEQSTQGTTSHGPTDLWALGIGLHELKRYPESADAFNKCAQSPGNLQETCKQLAHQAQDQEAKLHEEIWAPPDVDAPLASISTAEQCSLSDVLAHAGERAQELVANLQRFAAQEKDQFQQLDSFGFVRVTETATYDYVVSFQQLPGALSVSESRQVSAGGRGLIGAPQDNGLTALALIFHPYYQGDYNMACEGTADWNGTSAWVINFIQRKDRPSRTQGISTPQREIPLKLKGRAWIARDSYQVLHIETNLAEPVPMLKLSSDAVSISYAPVDFHAQNTQLWLPQNAETFTDMANLRSVVKHTFGDFVLFSVQSDQSVESPHQP